MTHPLVYAMYNLRWTSDLEMCSTEAYTPASQFSMQAKRLCPFLPAFCMVRLSLQGICAPEMEFNRQKFVRAAHEWGLQ